MIEMRTMKRIVELLLELFAEVLLMSCFLGLMILNKVEVFKGIFGFMLALPVILALFGYYISRLLACVTWVSKAKWLYPCSAALAFLAHALFIADKLRPDETPVARTISLPFVLGGTLIVFLCASIGNNLFRKWSPAVSSL